MSISKLLLRLAVAGLSACAVTTLNSQTLTWDASTASGGVQNGAGTWNTSGTNWWDGAANTSWVNGAAAVAQFGTPGSVSGSAISVAEDIQLAELRFLALGTGTPSSGHQYTLNGNTAGRVLDFGLNGLIQMEDYSSGGSQFVSLGANLSLKGENLRIQKLGAGTVFQFISLSMAANPDLTGTFTLGGSIYASINNPNTLQAVSRIVVEAGGSAALSSAGSNYTQPFSLAGFGNSLLATSTSYGAIRFGSSNLTVSGGILLTADAGVQTNASGANGLSGMVISGAITDNGEGHAFHRFALGRGNGTLSLTAANTYGGETVLGRAITGYSGGITILDFAAAGAPQDDILYNGLATPGGLTFLGGNSPSVLRLAGADAQTHSQRLGDVTAGGTHGVLELLPGAGGTMNVSLGAFTRTDNRATLAVLGPATGTVTSTHAEGFVGPWISYTAADGARSWARVTGGVLGAGFSGDTLFATGDDLNDDPYHSEAHVTVTSASAGPLLQSGGTTLLGTVSMNDTSVSRALPVGGGQTLKLGPLGGVQIVNGARNFTLGAQGVTSTLTAGGVTANTPGQLFLSNHSADSVLTVHSNIANNGNSSGAVTLLVNGAPGSRVVLTGTNTHSGGTVVSSGILEVRSDGALGSSGTVTVVDGATLALGGGRNITRALAAVAGFGDGGLGGIRSLDGENLIAAQVTQVAPTFFTAEAGSTLTLQRPNATDNMITSGYVPTFGGAGTVIVNSRIATSSSGPTKTGTGLLVLGGDNTFTGTFTISQGVVRVAHVNALGTTAGVTSISNGAALELGGGLTLSAEPVTLSSQGVGNRGGIRNVDGDNTLTGQITLNATTMRIHSDSGLLTLGGATGNATLHSSSSSRTLIFGGAGDIQVVRPMARTSAGNSTVTKEGNGTVTFASTVNNTVTNVNGGIMRLDFSAAGSPATNILNNAAPGALTLAGGTLALRGGPGAANSQTVGNLTVTNYSNLVFEQNSATTLDFTFGSLTRSWMGVLGITPATTGGISTTGGDDNAAITRDGRVYAFLRDPVNGDEWAATNTAVDGVRQIVPLSSIGGYTLSDATSLAGHADIAPGVTTTTLDAETTVSSLRFAQPQATQITQSGSQILNTGGILVSSTVGANPTTISTLSIRPTASVDNNPDFVIVQNNVLAPLIFESRIINRTESGRTTVSVVKTGPGTLVLKGANTFTGNFRVSDGVVHLASGSMSGSIEILLGYGSGNGKVILGDTAAYNTTIDYILVSGTGTDNRIVGGADAVSTLTLSSSTSTSLSSFANGFLGGPGTNEDNLALAFNRPLAVLELGPANTYDGKTTLRQGTVTVMKLADAGEASSFGKGSLDSVIEMGSVTSGATALMTLRHVGMDDSATDRVIALANSTAATTEVTAVIESAGAGEVSFTSPFISTGTNVTATRKLVLTGANTGANAMAGIGDNGGAPTILEKTGAGAWAITQGSTHSGGTFINEGTLRITNTSGSATGSGPVTVAVDATLAGTGAIIAGDGQDVTVAGTLSVGLEDMAAAVMRISTGTGGALAIDAGGRLVFDLVSGAGMGDNTGTPASADLLMVAGTITLAPGATLVVSNATDMMDWAEGDTWRIFDWTTLGGSEVTGAFTEYVLPSLPDGYGWDVGSLYTQGTLMVVVPEPGRMGFLGLFLTLWVLRRKRGRSEE